MGSADDGHAPLLQDFGDFRNGGAKLPLPVLAAVAAHEGDRLQRLFPIVRKGSLPLGKSPQAACTGADISGAETGKSCDPFYKLSSCPVRPG